MAEAPENHQGSTSGVRYKPNELLKSILESVGGSKETYSFSEVKYLLGKYIVQRKLFDEKQQHIVYCSNDALGGLFGVDTFSVREQRQVCEMIMQNLTVASDRRDEDGGVEEGPTCSANVCATCGCTRRGRRGEEETLEQAKRQRTLEEQKYGTAVTQDECNRKHSDSEHETDDEDAEEAGENESGESSDQFSVEYDVDSSSTSESCDGSEDGSSEESSEEEPSGCRVDAKDREGTEEEGRGGATAGTTDVGLCAICQCKRKNGCIVHGKTAHLFSCHRCARKLKRRGKPCPVCRQEIGSVVKLFIT